MAGGEARGNLPGTVNNISDGQLAWLTKAIDASGAGNGSLKPQSCHRPPNFTEVSVPVERHANYNDTRMRACEAIEQWHFDAAWYAPTRPEMNEHDLATRRGQIEACAIEQSHHQLRGRLGADSTGCSEQGKPRQQHPDNGFAKSHS